CPCALLSVGLGRGLRGLGLCLLWLSDAGDPHLGVLLPVTLAALVPRLVPAVDHSDLRPLGRADNLGRHQVTGELRRVADDRAAVYYEQRGERDARPGLLVRKLIDGKHVIEGDLLLPATAAHNRVHPRTASPCMRAPLPSDATNHCGWTCGPVAGSP